MRFIFTLIFLLSMSSILRAEQISFVPKPVPAPTSMRVVMDIERNESLSSKSAKDELKDLVAELKRNKDLIAYIIYSEKSARSKEGLRTANQIKNYLIKKEGVSSDRIVAVKSSDQLIWKIRIYLVPPAKAAEGSTEQSFEVSKVRKRKSNLPHVCYHHQTINRLKTAGF